MKRVIALNIKDEGKDFRTADVIITVAKAPGQGGGVTYDEMSNRLRILDVVEANKNAKEYLFEDNDFRNLERLVKSTPFGFADRDLKKILDNILAAEDVAVESTAKKDKKAA